MRFLSCPRARMVLVVFILLTAGVGLRVSTSAEEKEAGASGGADSLPSTVEEARARARWIHEMMHGALQVMHRDFFDDDDPGKIPSASLEDVFAEMERSWSVGIRWLGVNATKDIDHRPQNRFEESAVEALDGGASEFELASPGQFRFAGAIRLQNECLKCHVPNRTSLEDRVAGLVISIPLRPAEK